MSESSTPKKTTRSSRRGPEVPDEPETDIPAKDESAAEPTEEKTRSGPVTVVRDARTNPSADSDDSDSSGDRPSRRSDEARKESNHSPDEIPATIEGKEGKGGKDDKEEKATISDPSDSDKDDDRGKGRDRRGRGRERNGRRKPREDRDGGSNDADVDQDRLRDMAWKIYKSEVCEEGLALLDPRSMREYARSSFRAARVFLEEEQSQD